MKTYTLEQIEKEKIAIHTPTQEDYDSCVEFLLNKGYDGRSIHYPDVWEEEKNDTHIAMDPYTKEITTPYKPHLIKYGYKIIKLSQLKEYQEYKLEKIFDNLEDLKRFLIEIKGMKEEYVIDTDAGNKNPLELFKAGKAFVDIKNEQILDKALSILRKKKIIENGIWYTWVEIDDDNNNAFLSIIDKEAILITQNCFEGIFESNQEIRRFCFEGIFESNQEIRRFLTEIKGMKEITLEDLQPIKKVTIKEAIEQDITPLNKDDNKKIKRCKQLLRTEIEVK